MNRLRYPTEAEDTLIINDINVGFGRANNRALAVAKGATFVVEYGCIVSTDTLSKTLAYMDCHPRCGILECV
jgi:hypothetical protein